jgi:hypothetical protein
MLKRIVLTALIVSLVPPVCWATEPGLPDFPAILSIRDRAELVLQISQKRLEQLLGRFMRQTGFDMCIITCNEDNPDPVFETMTPYKNWCPITQLIVFFDLGPEEGVERLNISRSNFKGLYKDVWDAAAWDTEKKESQWDCLGRIVRERDPRRIGINEGEIQWAAGAPKILKDTAKMTRSFGPETSSTAMSG